MKAMIREQSSGVENTVDRSTRERFEAKDRAFRIVITAPNYKKT
jgi:hypothetical protein